MSSGQYPRGSNAASKFNLVSAGPTEGDKSVQEGIIKNVNDRMEKALEDLRINYEQSGKGFEATYNNQPTGSIYQKGFKNNYVSETKKKEFSTYDIKAKKAQTQFCELSQTSEDSDDELLNQLEDDPEIRHIREQRMQIMKKDNEQRLNYLAKGHGRFTEITQDEFLPEVTGTEYIVVHFYHNDFQKCKIMDFHMEKLAATHIECKFVKINAEKAPFFVQKLKIRVLPCLVIFKDGITVGEIKGFEGLNESMEKGQEDEWPTINLACRLSKLNVIQLHEEAQVEDSRSTEKKIFGGLHDVTEEED